VTISTGISLDGKVEYKIGNTAWTILDSTDVEKGSQIDLRAVPDAGYVFALWGGSITGTATSTSFTINKNTVINAAFIEEDRHSKLTLTYTIEIDNPEPSGPAKIPFTETFDFGEVQSIERKYSVTTLPQAIVTTSVRNAFLMDMGVSQDIDVSFRRLTPNGWEPNDDTSTDSKNWCNREWWMRFHNALDRWQMKSDGWTLRYIPNPLFAKELYPAFEYNTYVSAFPFKYQQTDVIDSSILFKIGLLKIKVEQPPQGIIRYHSDISGDYLDYHDPVDVTIPYGTTSIVRSIMDEWADDGLDDGLVFVGWKDSLSSDKQANIYYTGNEFIFGTDTPNLSPYGVLDLYAIWAKPKWIWHTTVEGENPIVTIGSMNADAGCVTNILKVIVHGAGGGGGPPSNLSGGGGGAGGQKVTFSGIPVSVADSFRANVGGGGIGGVYTPSMIGGTSEPGMDGNFTQFVLYDAGNTNAPIHTVRAFGGGGSTNDKGATCPLNTEMGLVEVGGAGGNGSMTNMTNFGATDGFGVNGGSAGNTGVMDVLAKAGGGGGSGVPNDKPFITVVGGNGSGGYTDGGAGGIGSGGGGGGYNAGVGFGTKAPAGGKGGRGYVIVYGFGD